MARQTQDPVTRNHQNTVANSAPAALTIADIPTGQGLTDRYDQVLLRVCESSPLTDALAEDAATRFCHHLRHALNADTVYVCNRASLSVVTSSSCNSARESCDDTRVLHSALTTMVSDLWNCDVPFCPPDIRVFPDDACFRYCVVPMNTQHDHLLIITNADLDSTLVGDYLADALSEIYALFIQSSPAVPAHSDLVPTVLDTLHSKYGISSKAITQKRIEHFTNQLKKHAVEFEGLSLASKSAKPGALSTTLPNFLYHVAKLWNNKFLTALDCNTLVESAHGHKTLCESEKLFKFSDSRSLKVRVHAESLSNLHYINELQVLFEQSILHPSKLNFSVIPQPGISHLKALQSLKERFGIPQTPKTKPAQKNFAEEFNIQQINGVGPVTTAKRNQASNT